MQPEPLARSLIIESSGRRGQTVLACGSEILHSRTLDDSRRNARDLAQATHDLLHIAGWEPSSLTAVIVGLGPGSYTGLRVGIISAKVLAWSLNLHFFGVETFAAIARRAPFAEGEIDILADALKSKVFRQRLRKQADGSSEVIKPLEIIPFEQWLSEAEPGVPVSGPGVSHFAMKMPSEIPQVAGEFREPDCESLLKVVIAQPERWRADYRLAEPIYLRGSYAEENVKPK